MKKARLEAQRDNLSEIKFPRELLSQGDKDTVDPIVRSQTNIFTQLKEYMRGEELIKREQEGASFCPKLMPCRHRTLRKCKSLHLSRKSSSELRSCTTRG